MDHASRRLLRKVRGVPGRARRLPGEVGRATRAFVRDPVETSRYVPEQLSRRFDKAVPYDVEEEWGRPVHELLGFPWPCSELSECNRVWDDIGADLRAQGLTFGRYTYGEYSDADGSLAAAAWCAIRHTRPAAVVETGVARGVTSRVILEALSANDDGHLWSIDLPHLFLPDLHQETAAAVPGRQHPRWTYLRGSSRGRLRPLLADLGQIDMFVHDSLHTGRNMRFEMTTAWASLADGGLMLVDDVHNQAFRDFVADAGRPPSLVCRSADGTWMFGVVRKPPAVKAE